MESLRRAYGIAEPVRRGMEMKIVKDGTFRPAVLGGNGVGGGNLHEEILAIGGRETEVGWEDVFVGLFSLSFPFLSLLCFACWLLVGRGADRYCTTGDEFREPPSMHDEMEKRLRMEF